MSVDLRSVLVQTLAARYGMSTETTELLEALQGSSNATPDIQTRMQELLAQASETNPALGLLLQHLNRQQEQIVDSELVPLEDKESEPAPNATELDNARERFSDMSRAVLRLREKVDRMYSELEELRVRNDTLATAVGACYLCWGEDPHCQVCGGIGLPGSFMPDLALFTKYVAPAARMLRKQSGTPLSSSGKIGREVSEHSEI